MRSRGDFSAVLLPLVCGALAIAAAVAIAASIAAYIAVPT